MHGIVVSLIVIMFVNIYLFLTEGWVRNISFLGGCKDPNAWRFWTILKNLFLPPANNYFCCHFLFSDFPLVKKISSEKRIRVGKFCTHRSSEFDSKVEGRQKNNNYVLSRPCHWNPRLFLFFFFFPPSGCRRTPPLLTVNHPHEFNSSAKYSSFSRKIKRGFSCFDCDSFRIPLDSKFNAL
jgi:hypothetical protein